MGVSAKDRIHVMLFKEGHDFFFQIFFITPSQRSKRRVMEDYNDEFYFLSHIFHVGLSHLN